MKCSFVGGKTPLAHLANRFSVSWMEGVFKCFFLKKNTLFEQICLFGWLPPNIYNKYTSRFERLDLRFKALACSCGENSSEELWSLSFAVRNSVFVPWVWKQCFCQKPCQKIHPFDKISATNTLPSFNFSTMFTTFVLHLATCRVFLVLHGRRHEVHHQIRPTSHNQKKTHELGFFQWTPVNDFCYLIHRHYTLCICMYIHNIRIHNIQRK